MYLPMQVIDDSFCGWIFNPSIVLFVGGGLHCIIEDKHIFARILHEVVAEPLDQECNGCGLSLGILGRY